MTANIGVNSLTFLIFLLSSYQAPINSLGVYSLLFLRFSVNFMVFLSVFGAFPLCSTLLWTQLRGHGRTVQKFTVLKIYKIMIQ